MQNKISSFLFIYNINIITYHKESMKTFVFTAFSFAAVFVFEQLSKFLLANRKREMYE